MQEILTVNELFSGIGAQRKALERLGIAHEVVGVCEIDKYAIQSYEAIFGKTYNYGDICTAPRLEYADLWTYSFPCQDISVAGNQKGISENTRSGLLYQVQRLLEVAKDEGKLPKYLLLENVKNLVGKKFKSQFDDWLFYLDQLGYDTYWQVLNAKNYGIPQNRERVFAISIRKDLGQAFEFPKPEELKIRLKDILEDEVDEKYYLSQDKVQNLVKTLEDKEISNTIRAGGRGSLDRHQWDLVAVGASRGRNPDNPSDRTVGAPTEQRLEINTQGTSNTITTVQKDNYVVEAKVVNPLKDKTPYGWHFEQAVYDSNGIARAVKAGGGSGNIPKVIESKVVEFGHYTYPNSDKKHQSNTVYSSDGLCPTLDTMQGGNRQPKILTYSPYVNKKYEQFIEKNKYVPELFNPYNCQEIKELAPTLTAQGDSVTKSCSVLKIEGLRIRKLTPLECWRLMGFDDEDFRKAEASGVSNTQLYKQAGNSIVVNVLEKIFENLCK